MKLPQDSGARILEPVEIPDSLICTLAKVLFIKFSFLYFQNFYIWFNYQIQCGVSQKNWGIIQNLDFVGISVRDNSDMDHPTRCIGLNELDHKLSSLLKITFWNLFRVFNGFVVKPVDIKKTDPDKKNKEEN